MNFIDLLKKAASIKNVFALAAVGFGLVWFFRDTIEKLALAGDSSTLNLLLAFLFFMVVGVVGVAVFFGISKEEIGLSKEKIEASKETNEADISGSKYFDGSQKGTGNKLKGTDVEGGSFHQDSRENPSTENDPQKKTPPQN